MLHQMRFYEQVLRWLESDTVKNFLAYSLEYKGGTGEEAGDRAAATAASGR